MMEKIKLITDTTSDIPEDLLEQYNIDMLSIPIAIDGEGFYERESFTLEEFIERLENSDEIPKTSRIALSVYQACYEKAYHEGYTHVYNITINAGGSGTNASAQQALAAFYDTHPEAREKISIKVIDSKTYSAAYGHGIVKLAEEIENGATVEEVEAFLDDWFHSIDIYLGCYSLEYARKSGRINAAVAFVGDMLGMRPVIRMVDGKTEIVSKVRGSLRLVDKLFDEYQKVKGKRPDIEVAVVHGRNIEESLRLKKMIEKDLGREIPLYPMGASIMINAGPDVCAFVIKGEKRC